MGDNLKININRQVEVTLTAVGRRVLQRYYIGLGTGPPEPLMRRDGRMTFTLWDLMHIFGPGLSIGATEVPFERNELTLLPAPYGDGPT